MHGRTASRHQDVRPLFWGDLKETALFVFSILAIILPSSAGAQRIEEGDSIEQESYLDWTGDLQLRYDHVSREEPIDRVRGRLRFGIRYFVGSWEMGAIEELTRGSNSALEETIRNDNELSNDLSTDEVYVRWSPSESISVMAGKTKLPIKVSPMLWDEDLRPIGLSAEGNVSIGDFDRLSLTVGWFEGAHLYNDKTRIVAAQTAWFWREGAPVSYTASLGYIKFYDTDGLVEERLLRTNGVLAGKSVVGATLADIQFGVSSNSEHWPIRFDINLVRNLGARSERDGARISVAAGSVRRKQGVEFGLTYERIQRDAVLAAFNSDDWWFHSDMQGVMSWIGYGLSDQWSVRVAGFFERRDRTDQRVERLLIDFRRNW
jgi:hypothetical protein